MDNNKIIITLKKYNYPFHQQQHQLLINNNEQEVETEAINTIEQQIEEVLNGSQIAENDYNDNNDNQNKEQTSKIMWIK